MSLDNDNHAESVSLLNRMRRKETTNEKQINKNFNNSYFYPNSNYRMYK
jgi:hypothetical protein